MNKSTLANALIYRCPSIGIPVTVVMPVTAPIMKVENCKKLGARVVIYGDNFGEAKKRALQIADRKKMLYVNGFVMRYLFSSSRLATSH